MVNLLKHMRDEDLRAAWDRLRRSGINLGMMPRRDVVALIARSPAPRFYITEKMAERYVCARLRGERMASTEAKRRMEDDLVAAYLRVTEADPTKPRWMVWLEVVNSPAPEFYAGRQTIENALFRRQRPPTPKGEATPSP